jgi:nudix-type nucleoside diphosphatase (YffH/AdpP family)
MKRVIIHEKRRVFDGFFKIDEVVVSYEGTDGGMVGPVRRLSLERGDSVAAVVFHRDRRCILLGCQFRYPTHDKGPGWLTEILAGMIDTGETPDQAIRREVREESGYEIEHLDSIGTFYLSPGGSSERIILYYAEVSDGSRVGPGGGQIGEGESIRLVEAPVDELVRDVMAGRVADAKTLVGLLWLMRARPDRAGT